MNEHVAVRVAIVTNILSPYRLPLYRRLANVPGFDLTVTLLGRAEANRQWKLESGDTGFVTQVLPGKSLFLWRWELPVHLNRGLSKLIEAIDPHVVIVSGWDQVGYWQAAWWCRRTRTPLVLHCGSTLLSGTHRSRPWETLRRVMVGMASAYVAYGSHARKFLLRLGAPADQVHVGLNTVDVDAFATAVEAVRARPNHPRLRATYPRTVLLYAGQLVPRKRVDLLLRSVASLEIDDVALLIVGSGPEEARLRVLARSLRLRHVYFEGFHQPEALTRYYALADALVLPSDREVWGLVVNEALAAGLYCICSDTVGAAFDVLYPGWNGDTFTAGRVEDLAVRLRAYVAMSSEVVERRNAIVADARARLGMSQLVEAFVAAIGQAARSDDRVPTSQC